MVPVITVTSVSSSVSHDGITNSSASSASSKYNFFIFLILAVGINVFVLKE